MPLPEPLQPVGRTTKVHGTRGELKARIEPPFLEAALAADFLFLDLDGQNVPFFVEEIRGQEDALFLKLEAIDSPQDALELSNRTLLLPASALEGVGEGSRGEPLRFANLQGYQACTVQGHVLGTIREVVEYPQQEMAVLERQGREVLVPLNEAFIAQVDAERRLVTLDLPEGLIEVQEG